jgi:LCP family protein required for cell wall assembly
MHDLLDRLDDPEPFTVSADLVHAAKARGARLRRRRRLGVTGAMVPVILVLALVAGAVYVDRRLDQVDRVDVAAGVLAPVAPGAPYNVLVVGTDAPLDGADGEGGRGDTIMIAQVDKAADRLAVIALPRDLVFRDGADTTDRLGDVLASGGPQALITAIRVHLGIDIAHYVQIDQPGFEKVIDAAGGVSLESSTPLRDAGTGLTLDGSCQHLDGAQALQLARSRRVEYRTPDGVWQLEPSGDLGRIQRQQEMLTLIVQQLQSLRTDPHTVSTLIDVFADNTTIDAGFDRKTLIDLAVWNRSTPPALVVMNGALPVVPFTRSDGSAVLLPGDDATRAVAQALANGATVSQGDDGTLDDQPSLAGIGPPLVWGDIGFTGC